MFSALLLLALAASARPSLLSDILTAFETAVDCASCHSVLLPPLQTAAHLGNDVFVSTLTTVCQTLKLAVDDVCAGEFHRSGPILAHSLRAFSVDGTTATKFCDAVFGLCQPPRVIPFTVPFPKAAPAIPKQFTSTGKAPFQVVHFSDVHIDRKYTVGADANCTKSICCRNFGDETGPATEPAGPFGNAHCDSPADLSQSMLRAIAGGELGFKAKFAVFTGDTVAGDTWLVDENEASRGLVDWNVDMLDGLTMTVYPSLGNDSVPVNSFPRNTTVTTLDPQWVFIIEKAGWKPWIGAAGADQVAHFSGSYAQVVPGTNLRILSINTQYWYKQNFWIYDSDTSIADPNGLLAFMVEQLQAAEDLGQRTWIIGHIPPGKADIVHDQSNSYDQIVQRYKNTIAAQFFGHSHKDEFEVAYSDYSNRTASNADSIVFIGPALTPTSGNPAFKLYDVDSDTYEILDAKTFITNISDPSFQTTPTWELYYSARESYGPLVGHLQAAEPLNAAFWHQLTEVFQANETAFQLYNTRISRGGAVSACTGYCKTMAICELRAARSEDNCDVSTPGIQLKKRATRGESRASDAPHEGRFGCNAGVSRLMTMFLAKRSA
ncbi:sphingomyelin phosphodiesterase [Auriscalpium vulgare]|uniref:Sphingomyelin phosphodiesterase n=1 Tax=Auriscalpium vulgare TaxID=40419 RepID=A0ACB8S2M3_9AGAM|nr:sphingomyelin phosphodiesterase [Auriscalpium vulgare]